MVDDARDTENKKLFFEIGKRQVDDIYQPPTCLELQFFMKRYCTVYVCLCVDSFAET